MRDADRGCLAPAGVRPHKSLPVQGWLSPRLLRQAASQVERHSTCGLTRCANAPSAESVGLTTSLSGIIRAGLHASDDFAYVPTMRIAVISDVHGNLIALEAVLNDLRDVAPDIIVNLGDLVSGPFDPAGSADAQMALACPTLAGNHERQVLAGGLGASDAIARPLLSRSHLDWMSSLPGTLSLVDGRIFACHGSPHGGDLEYLLEDVSTGRARLDTIEAIKPRLRGIGQAQVVLCGHTHMARAVSVGGVLVVNPGSVGLPGYSDTEPVSHVIESGSPHARYALIERCAGDWAAHLRMVPYRCEAAAQQAERYGRFQTAHVVRTGWWPSPSIETAK